MYFTFKARNYFLLFDLNFSALFDKANTLSDITYLDQTFKPFEQKMLYQNLHLISVNYFEPV